MGRKDKDFLGLEVVSLEDASVVGEVEGLIIDDKVNGVVGLLIDLGIYEAKVLAYSDVLSVGDDSVIIRSSTAVKRISEHTELEAVVARGVHVSDSLALSERGDIVGTTGDYFVDPPTGELRAIELIVEEDSGERVYTVPMSAVVRVGADLVLFAADFAERAVPSGEEL